jgi:REP element-mobilizing transposase RayT
MVALASRPRFGTVTIRDRGRLPHWEKDGATYFVTFRLGDSLPHSVLERIASQRKSLTATARQLGRALSASEIKHLKQLSTKQVEEYLDRGSGKCYLSDPRVAEIVVCALRYFNEKRYRLFAWCVMPNHVHVLFKLFPGHDLAEVLHSWKSFTAHEVKKLIHVPAAFWQREYYDHLIRDENEFARAIAYVADNPKKAGLRDWTWVWVRGRDALATAGEAPALR